MAGPPGRVCLAVFTGCISVKIRCIVAKAREGQAAVRPVCATLPDTAGGRRGIPGLRSGGERGEGAGQGLRVLTRLKNRGARDVLMLVCNGLSALPEVVNAIWPHHCVPDLCVRLTRHSLRYAPRRDAAEISRALKPVYTAVSPEQARDGLTEFGQK
ncbi:transposase [Streptomyces sp. NPDC005533]|uniref:transposase n=1 Tax=Streptomyces sp. NPDC005533 TaxID=3364723 RepID=UPI0036A6B448